MRLTPTPTRLCTCCRPGPPVAGGNWRPHGAPAARVCEARALYLHLADPHVVPRETDTEYQHDGVLPSRTAKDRRGTESRAPTVCGAGSGPVASGVYFRSWTESPSTPPRRCLGAEPRGRSPGAGWRPLRSPAALWAQRAAQASCHSRGVDVRQRHLIVFTIRQKASPTGLQTAQDGGEGKVGRSRPHRPNAPALGGRRGGTRAHAPPGPDLGPACPGPSPDGNQLPVLGPLPPRGPSPGRDRPEGHIS